MTVTDANVFDFAQMCARVYCKRYNAWSQLDDATQDACLYLLNAREKWAQPKSKLINRTVGELVRNYQKEHGLRRKNRPKKVDLNLSKIEDRRSESQEVDSRRLIVERALGQPDVAPYKALVQDLLACDASFAAIAKKHGVTKARVSQIFKLFKSVCRRLDADKSGVVLVDVEELDLTDAEKEKMRLFFQ